MLLHTPLYLLFLMLVTLTFWQIPHGNWRKVFLLFTSYIFYCALDIRFALLLASLTLAIYIFAKAINHRQHPKLFIGLSVVLNLGILMIFKCAGFFIPGIQLALQKMGIGTTLPVLLLIMPIGLSFYTFQAIAYTFEIYRQKIEPASLLDVSLYLSFFPKLLAGPFVRPIDFLRQISEPALPPNRTQLTSSIGLLILGLFKKVVLADSLAVLANVAFRASEYPPGANAFPAPLYWQGFYLYSFQIYADFSGYTDIARASAALLGFSMPENFKQPYLSISPTEFWNRWHMTLTQWFREYLFFPLSRWLMTLTKRRYTRAIQTSVTLITMALIGLWHGVAWTYLLWGIWQGLLLVMDRWHNFQPKRRWQKLVMIFANFHLIGIGWVLFRSNSLAEAGNFLIGLFSFEQLQWWKYYLPSILLVGVFIFGIDYYFEFKPSYITRWKYWQPALMIAAITAITVLWIIQIANGTPLKPFIYEAF